MDFLHANTKSLLDSGHQDGQYISAKDRDVIVIGGGDTGTDCVGTAMRHGCRSLLQFEILRSRRWSAPRTTRGHQWAEDLPPRLRPGRGAGALRPRPARILRGPPSASSATNRARSRELHTMRVEWVRDNGKFGVREIPGTEQVFPAQLVLLAMGFLGPENQLLDQLGVEKDQRTNARAGTRQFRHQRSRRVRRRRHAARQSLVVWAINEGRGAARECDRWLMGATQLP